MSNRQESVPGAKANRYEDILKAHSTTSSSADQSRSASEINRLGPMTVPLERNASNGSLARDALLDSSDDEATTETLIKPFGQATGKGVFWECRNCAYIRVAYHMLGNVGRAVIVVELYI
jgi:hypothetical protein